jgi:5-hydroxyisourate hydrolase
VSSSAWLDLMITTHVLDLAGGGPARGVSVTLEIQRSGGWQPVGRGATDENGRLATLSHGWDPVPGTYRLTFDLSGYLGERGIPQPFFPEATITFTVRDAADHYHVPLLISPFGYTTYRGT